MGTAAALLLGLAFMDAGVGPERSGDPSARAGEAGLFPREALVPEGEPRGVHLVPAASRELSKKELWLTEKATRRDAHIADRDLTRSINGARAPQRRRAPELTLSLPPVGTRIQPVTTLYNLRTREALPVIPGQPLEGRFHVFLRDHFTNQAKPMDARLIDVLTRVATKFRAARIEVVSGYRSPKYNLMLRKKGHEVARASQHTEGHAVDFRVRGVKTTALLKFVKSLRQGGVGYYPHSQFVHSDTGRVRFWKGS